MVRTVEKKYQIWLAGYYDDFNGARAIPDDRNQPSDTTYSALYSHFGNPMNGEAFLNPRFRFSAEERANDSAIVGQHASVLSGSAQNTYLQNDGIFEWLTWDDTRLSHDDWEGRVQLQYPDGHVANRYKFNNDSAYGSDFYQRFINGHNTDASYIVPTGDNDATFGRSNMKEFSDANYNNKEAGLTLSSTGRLFMQRAHLTGVFMGEALDQDHTTTTPLHTFQEIYSPAKKPFLCIQTTRRNSTDSSAIPTIIYDGHLNSRSDGDVFTTRVALQSMITTGAWPNVGIKFEIGFPVAQAGILNDSGYTGTAAITYTLNLAAISYDTQALLGQVTIDNVWLDVDFVFDYTNNQFDVWVNGVSHATNQAMNGGTTAADIYGYQITVTNEGSSGPFGFVSYLMLDRVGLVKYITDNLDRLTTSEELQITELSIHQTVNGISNCTITITDDPDLSSGVRGAASTDYLLNLKNIFVSSAPLNWSILVFTDIDSRIDRPVWRGEVSTFSIKQQKRSRTLTIRAMDSMAQLEKQVPLWDVGQKGENTSEDATDYWSYDAQGFRDIMYLGGGKLKLLDGNVGFDSDSSYKESADQRMQLGSGHPIQMYNNEDTYGPNNIEDEYEGYGIIGFVQNSSSETVAIMKDSSHGISETVPSGGVDIVSGKHTVSGATPSAPSSGDMVKFSSSTLTYTPEASKIVYIGKFPILDLAKEIGIHNDGSHIKRRVWNTFDNLHPAADDWGINSYHLMKVIIYFDADPSLKPGDEFFINRRNDANSVNLTSSYNVAHRVATVTKFRNYFANGTNWMDAPNYMWEVKTHTDYSGSESHGIYGLIGAGAFTPRTDTLLAGNLRFSWSNDVGVATNVTDTSLTDIKYRAIHARWMRDLPESLWFKYHFGHIQKNPVDEPPPQPITGYLRVGAQRTQYCRVDVSQTLSPTTTAIAVDETAYDAAPHAGVAEIWTTPNLSPATYGRATEYREKFIYQGKTAVSGTPNKWYLIGVKYITKTYAIDASYNYSEDGTNKRVYLRFQDFIRDGDSRPNFKHLWLLWADMRNNGFANADGSERKADFGLQYPISQNYDFDLYFADQVDADGNIDKFASLRAGEDLDVWNIDSTTDPFIQGPFSKPVNYDNKIAVSLSNTSGLRVTTSNTGSVVAGDYIYLINSTSHDALHLVSSVSTNSYIQTTTVWISSGEGTGGAFYCPIIGSEDDFSQYQDWEDKAGSLLVIDASKFFNLNTHANGGKTMQSAGGRTDLTDYVVEERSGFPTLIDNYWTEALASYQTTGTVTRQHENENRLISSATTATFGFVDGLIGLPVYDSSEFAEKGIGQLITVFSQTNNERNTNTDYFSWDGKLDTDYTAGGTITTVGNTTLYELQAVVTITRTGETHVTSGIKKGMVIERTNDAGTATYHNIIEVTSNTQLKVTSDNLWATTDTYRIPEQLAKIYVIDGSSLADDAALDPYLEEVLWDIYYAQSVEWEDLGMNLGLGTTEGEETTPIGYEVHATVYSKFMLRLMMHIKGFYKSKNGGTFWENDKIRMLWNAAIMDTWLPSARITSLFDINNVPISNMMTTYNNTSINDSYGSIIDSRGKTIGTTIKAIQSKSGHGSTNGLYTSFSFLIGKDNRFEFRPKYNSGIVFNRNNMMVSDIVSDLSSQITNVRVYYANGGAFADWPATNLSDSTNWKIIEYPDIWSGDEALLVAKQEYNQNKNNPLTLTIKPMLDGDDEFKIIESGRYGYIADPYIALDANDTSSNAGDVSVWTRLGTGGVLFQGMVNALDGNINTSLYYGSNHINDNKNRYGSSKEVQPTSYPIHWRYNYYWYGSNSISNAVQIVHIPNKTPFDSDATGEHLRMWIDLKSGQSGTDIDNAEFSVYVSDYSFSGTSRTAQISGSIVTKDVKHSGFYEIDFPSNYGAVANAKIVFSFNAEYCRALLRLRCGDPAATATVDGVADTSIILMQVATNTETIFPLGKRVYSEMGGGFRDERVIWYAPRIQICRDLSYAPATYVSVTDAGLELNAEPMVVKDLLWTVRAGRSERISLTLERDESIGAGGLISYLFPKNNGNRQGGSNSGGGGNSAYDEPDNDSTPPSNDAGSITDPNNQKPNDGGTKDGTGTSYDSSSGIGVGSFSSTTYGKISGRMNLPSDSLSSDSQFSILGQDKPSSTPSSMRGIEGMDVDINTVSGTASVSADGYVLGGKGLMGAEGSAAASQEVSIQTDFSVPRDILSNRLSIQAKVTHSPSVAGDTKAVLYVTVTVKETGETVTNSVKVGSGVSNQTISLLPNRPIAGLRKSGRHIKVTITRKPGIGDDNANTTSVTLHSLDIRMQRASAHTASSSAQFSPP